MSAKLTIGIVAGEASGDILGAGLMRAIKQTHADAQFVGVGGPLMLAAGFNSLYSMDRLSVMGLVEPLKRLPELLRMRRGLRDYFIASQPDLFIGIDSPDFNLGLELSLRREGILTAHYVSPSVWAWRRRRVLKIAKAVDRMLTLFPFEAKFYREHNVPVTFVGHPLADQLPLICDTAAARSELGFNNTDTVIALLPGSRGGEIAHLGEAFIETARWCLHQRPGIKFVMPAANPNRMAQLQLLIKRHGIGLPIQLIEGQSRTAMAASDVVLMASGTTTLEAMLLKKPMVAAYRLSPVSYALLSPLVKVDHYTLPNLLAGEPLIPEVIQNDVRPEMLGPLLLDRLNDKAGTQRLVERFTQIHQSLRLGASEKAAEILLRMIEKKRSGI